MGPVGTRGNGQDREIYGIVRYPASVATTRTAAAEAGEFGEYKLRMSFFVSGGAVVGSKLMRWM